MLEMAGYDKLIGASSLLNPDLSLKRHGNPLVDYLKSLDCRLSG